MKIKLLLLVTILCMLFASLAVTSSAADTDEDLAEAVLTYEGVSARLKGDGYGIRSVWSIDKSALADLEAKGYTVAIGAVMGISEYNGGVYNAESESLTVAPHTYLGATTENTAAEAIVVYGTGNATYASRIFIGENDKTIRFAYTTTYGESSSTQQLLEAKIVYRGFVILTKDGASTVYYDNAVPESAPIDEQISISALSSFFMDVYAGADAEAFKNSEKIREVIAMCGKTVSLANGSSVLLGSSKDNVVSVSVNVPIAGYYRVDALVNYNSGYVDYFYCKNKKTSMTTAGRLGTNSTDAKAKNDTAAEVGDVTSTTPETVAYTYLAGGDNTLQLYATRYVAVKEITVSLVKSVDTAANDFVRDARNPDSAVVDNTDTDGKLTESQDGILLRADQYGKNHATYKITPTVSGRYSIALLAATEASRVSITVEDGSGAQQRFTVDGKINLGSCSSGASFIAPSGEVTLKAGKTYSLTLKNESTASSWFYVRQIAFCYEGEIEDSADNESGIEILFKNMATKPSNATLLADNRTYFISGSSTASFSLTVPEAGVYGVRMKYVNTVDSTTYRAQFYLSSSKHTEHTRSRLAGVTTAYSCDKNAFVFPVSERNTEYTETVAYQYLSAGKNTVTITFESSNTKGIGVYGLEYYPVSTGEDVRLTVPDKSVEEIDIVKGSSTDSRTQANGNLFIRKNDVATWESTLNVSVSGVYDVHSLVATGGGKLTYTFTNTETGEVFTSTYSGEVNMGGCSTSIAAISLSSVTLPKGNYSFSVTTTGGWMNFADVRLTRDRSISYLGAGDTGDIAAITPERDGYYEIVTKAPGTASLALLLDGNTVATLDATASDAVSKRSFTKLFLKEGTTYSFALKNTGSDTVLAAAPTVSFVGERNPANGYFVDMIPEEMPPRTETTRLELDKNLINSNNVSLVDKDGKAVTLTTSNTSTTIPYSYNGGKILANATNFGYASNSNYCHGIKMKDGDGSSPLGIRFTVEKAGNYDVALIYSTASAGTAAKVTVGVDAVPATNAEKTVLVGEANRTSLHSQSLESIYLTEGEHTIYLYSAGSYSFWIHALELTQTVNVTETDLVFKPAYSGDYRVTVSLKGGEEISFMLDAVAKGNESALFTGDCFSASVPATTAESAVFVNKTYTFMAGMEYTVRLSIPASRVASVSFDLEEKVEGQFIRLPESNHTGTVTTTNTYTDLTYVGFSKASQNVTNYADYGYSSAKIDLWRSQDKGSGNKVLYDPMGIRFSVEESGYYDLSLVYYTAGTSAAIAAYMDGKVTEGYWVEDPTTSDDGKNLVGTWVPYAYPEGDSGTVLSTKISCPISTGTLADVTVASSIYLEAGEHTLYIANVGSYTLYMAALSIEPHDDASEYKDFSSTVSIAYDDTTDTASAQISASGRNSLGFPGYRLTLTAYDKNNVVLGTAYYDSADFVTKDIVLTVENIPDYDHSAVSFTDVFGATLAPDFEHTFEDYRVIFLSDTHLYDWENMFFDNSAQRTAWAVEAALKEHAFSPIDAVILPGDVVNNYLYEYKAGTFAGWEYVDEDGVTHTSQYKGVSYPAGSSGTENDPLGVLRILSYMELMQPLLDAGIAVYPVHGNHDCYRDSIFEMGFKMNQSEGYLGGALQYEEDADGNLLVPDYKIENGVISLYTRTVAPADEDYIGYAKGYGKDYAFRINDTTAFMAFDNYYNRSEDPTDNGFIANASGRSWAEQVIAQETVDALVSLTASYADVYVVLHSMTTNQTALKAAIKNNSNIVAVFDGHTHYETAKPNAFSTGKYVFTCGYFGVPMMNDQQYFQERPFSYRMLDKNGDTLRSYIVLPEKDYPAYTFEGSSGAYIPAFYQEYLRRVATIIR